MPGRQGIKDADYLFDGNQTLVALTTELHQAMKSAMKAHTWPFLEELAGWDNNNLESNIIHFAAEDHSSDKVPSEGAIKTLQNYMPIVESA